MKFKIISLFILLIFMPCVLANTEYINWGFGYQTIGLAERGQLWGSLGGKGSIPIGNITLTLANIDLPHVIDLDHDGKNEMIFYTGTNIFMYNDDGSYLSNYPVSHIYRRGAILAQNGTEPNLYVLIKNNYGDWYIDVLKKTGDALIRKDRLNITDSDYPGFIFGNYDIYIPDVSMNISIFSKTDGSLRSKVITEEGSIIYEGTAARNQTFFNPFIVGDYNRDGYDEFVYVYKKGSLGKASSYDTSSSSFNAENISISGGSPMRSANIMAGSIGSSDAYPSIVISTSDVGNVEVRVLDFSLNTLFTSGLTGSSHFPTTMINDIDSDGNNEFCYTNFVTAGLRCYDSLFMLKETFLQAYLPSSIADGQLASGRYAKHEYADFLAEDGIYTRNSSNMSRFYKVFGFPSNVFNFIPVSIKDKENFILDILAVGKTQSIIFFSNPLSAICGNDVCNSGENALTCPSDCSLILPTDAVLTEVFINPCNTIGWLQNTTVEVSAKAETLDGSMINISAFMYYGSAFQSYTSNFVASGSTILFNFIANSTCSGCTLLVSAVSEGSVNENTLSFPFTVSSYSGISFGDSSCGITQPLDEVLAQFNASQTMNVTGNAVVSALTALNAWLKIGLPALWVLLMIGLSAIIFIIGYNMHAPAGLLIGLIFFLDGAMLILGAILQIINTGIAIGLIVMGIIAVVIGITKKVTPS